MVQASKVFLSGRIPVSILISALTDPVASFHSTQFHLIESFKIIFYKASLVSPKEGLHASSVWCGCNLKSLYIILLHASPLLGRLLQLMRQQRETKLNKTWMTTWIPVLKFGILVASQNTVFRTNQKKGTTKGLSPPTTEKLQYMRGPRSGPYIWWFAFKLKRRWIQNL